MRQTLQSVTILLQFKVRQVLKSVTLLQSVTEHACFGPCVIGVLEFVLRVLNSAWDCDCSVASENQVLVFFKKQATTGAIKFSHF